MELHGLYGWGLILQQYCILLICYICFRSVILIGHEHAYELKLVSKGLHIISQDMEKMELSLQLKTIRHCK